jgi:hypothetical protein
MHVRAAELISALSLSPHAEGGYFREIHRSPASVDPSDRRGQRAALTAIYFLLAAGDMSCWHRVASDEAWHFLEGDPLELHEVDPTLDRVVTTRLGPYDESTEPAHIIVAGSWQAARSMGEYTLVGCTVGPGFDYVDFALLRDFPAEAESLRLKHPTLALFI